MKKPRKLTQLELLKSAFRRTWTISPVQKATPSKKEYDRKKEKHIPSEEE